MKKKHFLLLAGKKKNEQLFQTKPFGFLSPPLFSFLLFFSFFFFLVSVWSPSTKKPGGSSRCQEGNRRVGSPSCFCRTRIGGASLTAFALRSGIYLPLGFCFFFSPSDICKDERRTSASTHEGVLSRTARWIWWFPVPFCSRRQCCLL